MIRLIRLEVSNFAAIGHVGIDFGPGLNVLYGPNDLGKSTLSESIRLALLLPHASTYSADYVPWSGGGEPVVELTFTSGDQRIHRVHKQFGKAGSSLLQESRNGREFEEVTRGRGVDGALRQILNWGIPEPGGMSAPKGLPPSFLATALLSTQQDVSAILSNNLRDDLTSSGKEQIAAALEAIAQDPKFVELLRTVQEERNAAYTEKGAKKTARGSVFKEAADRVNEARLEVDRLQRIVYDSEGAEQKLRELHEQRGRAQEKFATANALHAHLQLLARQTAERSGAQERLRVAEEALRTIHALHHDIETGERRFTELAGRVGDSTRALETTKKLHSDAQAAFWTAQEAVRAEQANPAATDARVLARRSAVTDQIRNLKQRMGDLQTAKALAEAALLKDRELRTQEALATNASAARAEAVAQEQRANEELVHNGLLEKMLDVQTADRQAQTARDAVEKKTELEARLQAALEVQARLAVERDAIVVPAGHLVGSMRKLANERAHARGALDVGLVATIVPNRAIDMTIRSDAAEARSFSTAETQEVEARAELEVTFAGVGTVRVKGGLRAVQARAAALEDQWDREVLPHLAAAGVNDLEGLDRKAGDAQRLDASLKAQEHTLEALRLQLMQFEPASAALTTAEQAAADRRKALGDVDFARVHAEVAALGPDAATKLRYMRQQGSGKIDAARSRSNQLAHNCTLADERVRQMRQALETATAQRDAAALPYAQGVDAALSSTRSELSALESEALTIAAELVEHEKHSAARSQQLQTALNTAEAQEKKAAAAADMANRQHEILIADRASEDGRLRELRKQRDATDLPSSKDRVRLAEQQLALLPVPERSVSEEEVAIAGNAMSNLQVDLDALQGEILKARGALEHVGGAVARERLADANDALAITEQREREVEANSEAWKLLLEQMKEADAAQASNLGLALTPAVADRFTELTRQRYQSVKLSAQLETEGVEVAGGVRSAFSLSVGTRDQLSTLFRLALAEYLQATVVLDDQLVQSDGERMEWFRRMLYEKARQFQIIVLTCRPEDYLPQAFRVPDGTALHLDMEGQSVRAVDLGRALHRR